MNILSIKNISKTYPGFKLENISFDVAKGTIMGFIGRNVPRYILKKYIT